MIVPEILILMCASFFAIPWNSVKCIESNHHQKLIALEVDMEIDCLKSNTTTCMFIDLTLEMSSVIRVPFFILSLSVWKFILFNIIEHGYLCFGFRWEHFNNAENYVHFVSKTMARSGAVAILCILLTLANFHIQGVFYGEILCWFLILCNLVSILLIQESCQLCIKSGCGHGLCEVDNGK